MLVFFWGGGVKMLKNIVENKVRQVLKCYYDQKYEFFVLSIFRKYKYILLTVQSLKSKFGREVRLF